MAANFFDQFLTPVFMGIPLVIVALMAPALLFPAPTARWLNNRLITLQSLFMKRCTHQLFTPMNIKGHYWALMFMGLTMYLLAINILGLLPYTFTPTTQLSMNMAMAIPLWLATVIIGLWNNPTAALAHLVPEGTPTPLVPILIIIETISLLIRPVSLGVRLTANLTAGHLLMQLISSASFAMFCTAPGVGLLTVAVLMLLTVLEVAVAVIQAYVFVLLVSLYLQENL